MTQKKSGLKLNDKEKTVVADTIDMAVEGHKESKVLATTDRSFESAEALVEFMNDTDDTIKTLIDAKGKILDG